MFLPPPDNSSKESANRDPRGPDPAILFLLTLFSLITLGLFWWAPTFKPRWAYLVVQCCIDAIVIGAGITAMIIGEHLTGVILLLLSIAGLAVLFLRPENGQEQDGRG
jgi:hypothetical protein